MRQAMTAVVAPLFDIRPLSHGLRITHGQRAASRAFVGALLTLSLSVGMLGEALAQDVPAQAPAHAVLAPSPEFAQFPRYEGTLGTRSIVLRLGRKTDDPSGVHGEFQFADTGQVVLVAGDLVDGTLEIEESDDGTEISGNWVGKVAADGSLSGDRMNVDDSDPQPFSLRPMSAQARAASAGIRQSGSPAAHE
ncbi:hypothetical protein [Trinickia fusca]|uniref:hypothetical protein n=1 Tax=Trinickia fusca TaxID=2419777 RepID=UPI001FE9E351|nr:hypothetical protein [Trinickia fusca]